MAGPVSKTAKAAMGDKGLTGKRALGGKLVVPTLYYGKAVGHGRYMAGAVDGKLVRDENGKPKLLRDVGDVVG
jgi:hypothetical protein